MERAAVLKEQYHIQRAEYGATYKVGEFRKQLRNILRTAAIDPQAQARLERADIAKRVKESERKRKSKRLLALRNKLHKQQEIGKVKALKKSRKLELRERQKAAVIEERKKEQMKKTLGKVRLIELEVELRKRQERRKQVENWLHTAQQKSQVASKRLEKALQLVSRHRKALANMDSKDSDLKAKMAAIKNDGFGKRSER